MDWARELTRFAVHAAVAAAALFVVLGPLRARLARFVAWIGSARRGRFLAAAVALTLGVRLALLPVVHPVYEADVKEYVEKAVAIATDGNPRA